MVEDVQLRHAEALDAKAGIVVGFAAAIVALAGRSDTWIGQVGTLVAALTAALAVWAFFPRPFPILELRPTRDLLVRSAPEFIRIRLIDTHIEMAESVAKLVERKTRRMKVAMVMMVVATALLAIDIL